MFTNTSCTIIRGDIRQHFPSVYWQQNIAENMNNNQREPMDSLLLIIPTRAEIDIKNDDLIFKGNVDDSMPVNDLRSQGGYYAVKGVKPYLWGANPHYEITGE